MSKKLLGIILIAIIPTVIYFTATKDQVKKTQIDIEKASLAPGLIMETKPKEPTLLYGIPVDSMLVIDDVIKPNQNLSEILSQYNVSFAAIDKLAKMSKDIFDVRKIKAHQKYTLICNTDSLRTAQCFVYEPNDVEYVVFHLQDSLSIVKKQREVDVVEQHITGKITTNLSDAMLESDASPMLVNRFVDIYAWQIDFFRLQKGDKFKIIFEEERVGEKVVGYGKIMGAYFEHMGEPFYAVHFDQGSGVDYFDTEGNSLRKAFLRDPLEYTRISSRYSPRRFHPVQKRWKAHLGTDYAAPTGTPIRSVGGGVVVEARYSRYNGNYVKIKHNHTYTTQYLHMSGIASGIRKGKRVEQGQTIGYVGSTGLATGPHLCYRFWKNGRQVDALKVDIPPSEPIKDDYANAYEEVKNDIVEQLDALEYKHNGSVLAKAG